jgi:hypothetical protein
MECITQACSAKGRETGQQGLAIAEGAYIPPTPFKISSKRFEKRGCGGIVGGEGGKRMSALKLYVLILTKPRPTPTKGRSGISGGLLSAGARAAGVYIEFFENRLFFLSFPPVFFPF